MKRHDNKPDSYFIKTFNPEKNDFSASLVCNPAGDIEIIPVASKNNRFHRWKIDHSETQLTTSANVYICPLATSPGSLFSGKCLQQYYDSLGKSNFELVNKTNIQKNWRYNTYVQDLLPKKQ